LVPFKKKDPVNIDPPDNGGWGKDIPLLNPIKEIGNGHYDDMFVSIDTVNGTAIIDQKRTSLAIL